MVVVHRVEFGDGSEQVVRFTCTGVSAAPVPTGAPTHVVEHTRKEPGACTVTFHYGPPCGEATSSVAHGVTVSG